MNDDVRERANPNHARLERVREYRRLCAAEIQMEPSAYHFTLVDVADFAASEAAALTAELDALKAALELMLDRYEPIDNGVCTFCYHGHRLYDLKGNPGECDQPECGSHKVQAALDSIGEKGEV